MRLSEIKDKLYSKKSDIASRKAGHESFDPHTAKGDEANKEEEQINKKGWVIEAGTTSKQKNLLLLIGAIIAGTVLLFGGGYLLYKIIKKDFKQEQVQLDIEAPASANIGDSITISLSYANYNPIILRNTRVTLQLPSTFQLESTSPQANTTTKSTAEWNLGELSPRGNGVLEVKGVFLERPEDVAYINAIIAYTPANISSPFQNEDQTGINVIGVPLSISVQGTRTVPSGYEVEYDIFVRNQGKEPFQNLEVNFEYPQGFNFVSSSTEMSGENNSTWNIPNLLSNEEKTLKLRGRMNGKAGERKLMKVKLGKKEDNEWKQYLEKEQVTSITEPPLGVRQTINGQTSATVHAGDEDIKFEVEYANNSQRSIGEAIIKVKLEGNIFDWGSIDVDKGGFDLDKKEVIWQGSGVPALTMLNPGDRGTLFFTLDIPEHVLYEDDKKSNLFGKTTVSIDSPHMPTEIGANKTVGGNVLDIKLGTKTFLQTQGFYNDGTIPNEGPVPPTSGKTTTYTIHWTITNIFNELRNVKVETALPFGVEYTGQAFPTTSGVEYVERTKELTWNVERVSAGAGNYNPAPSLIFQIRIKPTENDVGKFFNLLGETTLEAVDTFTGENIQIKSSGGIDSRLPDDDSINDDLGKVVNPGDIFTD